MPLNVFVKCFASNATELKLVLLAWILVHLVEQENIYWVSLCPTYGNFNKETAVDK